MATAIKAQKVECLNPNTGRKMNVDKSVYDRIAKAVYHTLKKEAPLTFTQLQQGVEDCLQQQKTQFDGSVAWYTVTVKNDLHARAVIDVFTEKGKKLHRLKK